MQTKKWGVCILRPYQVFLHVFKVYEWNLPGYCGCRKCPILKNWNKMGKRQVQNTCKINVNILHQVACKILNKSSKGYSSHCWRRSAAVNLANTGVSLINLKQRRHWQSNRVVEGYIANSQPLCQKCLNCLLPAGESEQVGQVNSKHDTQAIETYELYLDLSENNSNLPITKPGNGNWPYMGLASLMFQKWELKWQIQPIQEYQY